MEWKISDLLDGIEDTGVEWKEMQAVSTERVKEMAMSKIHNKQKARHIKRPAVLALVAALALGVTALAASGIMPFAHKGSDAEFFDGAFGAGGYAQEAYDLEVTDEDGTVVKTEHYPAVERVELDETQAALLGDSIQHIDKGVTIGETSFIVRSLVLDENNIGVMTCELQNPNGAADKHAIWFTLETKSGRMMDTKPYTQETTGDSTIIVYYIAPFEECKGEPLSLRFRYLDGEKEQIVPEALTLSNPAPVTATAFSADGAAAEVSPMGMLLCVADAVNGENVDDEITVRYTDSVYTVKGADVENIAVSARCDDGVAYAFNRLVDVKSVAEISVAGHCGGNAYEYVLKR